jgi:hypothetical protein
MTSTNSKDFCFLKNPNLPDFEKRINLIARILQVPAGSQNMKGLLIFFYFHIWLIEPNLAISSCE